MTIKNGKKTAYCGKYCPFDYEERCKFKNKFKKKKYRKRKPMFLEEWKKTYKIKKNGKVFKDRVEIMVNIYYYNIAQSLNMPHV